MTKSNALINVIYLGENIMLGNCRRAVAIHSGETIWDADEQPGSTLLSSCTTIGPNGTDFFRALDCINGTMLPEHVLGNAPINLTTLQTVFEKGTYDCLLNHG